MAGEKRITVNLSLRGASAVESLQDATGDKLTDIVNDALRVYARLVLDPAAQLHVVTNDGRCERIHLL